MADALGASTPRGSTAGGDASADGRAGDDLEAARGTSRLSCQRKGGESDVELDLARTQLDLRVGLSVCAC